MAAHDFRQAERFAHAAVQPGGSFAARLALGRALAKADRAGTLGPDASYASLRAIRHHVAWLTALAARRRVHACSPAGKSSGAGRGARL
jgi:hypothetical protein